MTFPAITGRCRGMFKTLCRTKYLEILGTLSPKAASSIIAREIQDFNEKKAIVMRVMIGIRARDFCIHQIEEISAKDFSNNQAITQEKIDSVSGQRPKSILGCASNR